MSFGCGVRQTLFAVTFGGLCTAACASATGSSGTPSNRDVIASGEIRQQEDRDTNAYDLIQRVRPQWLLSRGSALSGPFYAEVFLDGTRYGELDALRQISTRDVREIRYYDSRDATTLYGTGYLGGVIHVRTRP